MPDGRRLLSCSQNGGAALERDELQRDDEAHDYDPGGVLEQNNWLLTGDDTGRIKYWQTNLNNLKSVNAHASPCGVSFAPRFKVCSCSTTRRCAGRLCRGGAVHRCRDTAATSSAWIGTRTRACSRPGARTR